MDDSYKLVSLKISLARQRCEALGEELQSLRTKDYASPGSNRLLNLVAAAIDAIEKFLQTEEQIAGTGLLGGAELETRVHRAAQLIPYLHQILGYIEGSDTSCTPTPLIAQLGRFANSSITFLRGDRQCGHGAQLFNSGTGRKHSRTVPRDSLGK